MKLYDISGAGMQYGAATVLHDVSLQMSAGEFVTIAGPNGAGKSTLLGIMAGLREGHAGHCKLENREVREWPRKAFAKIVSVVPQTMRIEFGFSAEQVVLMGRTAHAGALFESAHDHNEMVRAMELTETLEFRDRDIRTLSGGEKQRVIVAAALAQSPRVLLLDEPTSFLDIEHQISLYRLLRELARGGVLVVSVTHDLNLAAGYASRIVLLRKGALVADGSPSEVLNAATIRDVFRVDAQVIPQPDGSQWINYER